MEIYTIQSTDLDNCACGNAVRHWKKSSKQHQGFCKVEHCWSEVDGVGQITDSQPGDDHRFLVPMCRMHTKFVGHKVQLKAGTFKLSLSEFKVCCKSEESEQIIPQQGNLEKSE